MEDMRVKGRSGFNGSIPNTGTDCLNGHEYTPENTRMNGKQRICRECNRLACQRYHERRAAKQEAA